MCALYLNKQKVEFASSDLIGEGGEAEVYKMGNELAVKVFKQANHPCFAGLPQLKLLVEDKQKERQAKLPSFPRALPRNLIVPQEMLYESPAGGDILAYSMEYLDAAQPIFSYSRRDFREAHGIKEKQLQEVFFSMHQTLSKLHSCGIVVGDLNPFNVLVRGKDVFFIDADSMQFGSFYCSTFCGRYVDPLNCAPNLKQLVLNKRHSVDSDWYSFAVMLFESLLYVHPYGGIYRPANLADRVLAEERPLRRITVMHPEVQYPVAAIPYKQLSADLLGYFESVFKADLRGPMPESLLYGIGSGGTLASFVPVKTALQAPTSRPESELVKSPVFGPRGKILQVVVQNGFLYYLYWDNGKFVRESGALVMSGDCTPDLHFKIQGANTVVGRGDCLYLLAPNSSPERFSVDSYRGAFPVFDVNDRSCFWMDGGKIWKNVASLPKQIQEALSNQTRIWVGDRRGFGFYQAGAFGRSFLFDCDNGTRFNLAQDLLPANVLDAEVFFSSTLVFVLTQRREGAQLINRCVALDPTGKILASEEALISDEGWLGRIHGKCAASKKIGVDAYADFLLSTVEGGLLQLGVDKGHFVELKHYRVSSISKDDNLIQAEKGLYVWNSATINLVASGH